jgi:hypothetical protein
MLQMLTEGTRRINWHGNPYQYWGSYFFLSVLKGRAIAQAVSRWLPTVTARVQNRI